MIIFTLSLLASKALQMCFVIVPVLGTQEGLGAPIDVLLSCRDAGRGGGFPQAQAPSLGHLPLLLDSGARA